MAEINLFDEWQNLPQSSPETWIVPTKRGADPENWYAEPFTKRTGCGTPGQCGGACDCGCPYNTMTELDRLPRINEIAALFPNEWLAFIISPEEDDEFEPSHGKLIAHSPAPDAVYDAVNTVLWNQHVFIYFNGDYDSMQASYGLTWDTPAVPPSKRVASGPKQLQQVAAKQPLPDELLALIYSAADQLYDIPNLNEATRRLRLARVRATQQDAKQPLIPMLDQALDMLETALPRVDEVAWLIEESLAELEETV